ncbi:hypothetical protein PBCV1_A678R [Paramecium bursaria Chlorella virus 1]|uniref:Chitin-binding type-2 domain-containing protein n=1 Tax=Paramecium bursaria Chlorella virus 1 TaxID=10506 RepID=O41160_PBCV1|nr:hypothetical protein PBCV1_A678R [Paramecium bursaria Chlorella virus 1]AAC96985.1 hypothetical protein [Paramecium bursaria Chlorella virus 1]
MSCKGKSGKLFGRENDSHYFVCISDTTEPIRMQCAPGSLWSTSLGECGNLTDYGHAPLPPTKPPSTKPPSTKPPSTKPPSTKPPSTKPPSTKPPSTKPPSTKPPSTKPPSTKPPSTKPPTSSRSIQVNPQGVGDLKYPKVLPSLPATAIPPSGSTIGSSLSYFKFDESRVNPPGAAPEIKNLVQVAPGITLHGLRFRGKWNDGDRDLTTSYHSYKARAEMSGLGGKTPYKLGGTYLIGTTIFLAPDFEPSDMYTDLMQPIQFQSFFTISGSGDNLTGSLYAFEKGLGSKQILIRSVKIPRGQWVTIVLKVKLAQNGSYALSVNGDEFKGLNLDTTIGKKGSGNTVGKVNEFGGTYGLYCTNTTNGKRSTKDRVVFHANPFWKKIA